MPKALAKKLILILTLYIFIFVKITGYKTIITVLLRTGSNPPDINRFGSDTVHVQGKFT